MAQVQPVSESLLRWGPRTVRVLPVLAAFALVCGAAAAVPLATATERVGLADAGTQPDADVVGGVSITPDARFAVFASASPNLAAGASGGTGPFVYLRDRVAGRTELISRAGDGSAPNGASANTLGAPVIDGSGRYVAFSSLASNLVSGDTNAAADVFVVDRSTGGVQRVSVRSDGTQASGGSQNPSISGDGRFVVFQSAAANLVGGDTNNAVDVFVHDLQTGTTTRASIATDGTEANASSTVTSGALSTDGRYVAFSSTASNLVGGADQNGATSDVFVRDLQLQMTELAALSSTGAQPAGGALNAYLGGNGRYVAFQCTLVCGAVAGNQMTNAVFVRDRSDGTVQEATVSTAGDEAGAPSFIGGLSPDGRHVAFSSNASNLAAPATGLYDFYVRDLDAQTTERVSVATDGTAANDSSITTGQVLSGDGSKVLFSSTATNLVAGDTNARRDLFLRDRGGAAPPPPPPDGGSAGTGVVAEVLPALTVALDHTTVDFGPLAPGASATRPLTATVTSNDAAGYQLTVTRTAFTPGELPLAIACDACGLAQAPVPTSGLLTVASTTTTSAAGGDAWATTLALGPVPASARSGSYSSTLTFTVVGL